ncbi:MAG: molybdopterin-dependent oxidoreductase [Candidatus Omnitrophica bacterium]|nr:molybdopterin-dependent oxidoreductase [Candidatus Omnitrophota bacterium]
MAHRLTTCTFCGVGCGIYLETAGNRVMGAYPSMSHPTNQGRICIRGWNVHEVASSPDRLKTPLIKKNGQFHEASWDEALGLVARRLTEIRDRHGPDALAFFNSPRCSNEESYLLQKLARAVIGTHNVDHGTGVYCNNSIHVLLDMLGLPATTNSIGELDQSEVIVVDGVDLARQLPTIGGRVIQARLKGAKVIVIDTRRHRLAENADFFLQVRPGTEVLLYGAMAKVIVDRGLMNLPFIHAHCRQYEDFLDKVRDYDLLSAADLCGVPADLIEAAALAYAGASSAALLYSTGIEARGKESIRAIVNLALLTGQIGKPGAGLYALTEHNNLQGVCDMGMLPDRLPGYQPISNDAFRARLESLWSAKLPVQTGLGAGGLFQSGGRSKIKALWLGRYDPVTTALFGNVVESLKQLELVVVQHLFMTGTAQYADVILPVVAFGEEKVSFTSTDRRIQLAEKVIDPPPGPRPAWEQITQLARHLGADWSYANTSEIMDEIGEVIPFYSGASHENLARDYGRQWPCTKDKPLGTRYLFEEGLTGQPFKFLPIVKPGATTAITADYPLALVFGHSLYYWNQNVLIKHSETLKREYRILLLDYPDGFVEINSEDARQMGLRDGQKIRLRAPSGSAVTSARVTHEVKAGTIIVPFFVREVQKQILGETAADTGILKHPVCVRIEKV